MVLAGTGAIMVNEVSGGQITHVGIALTFGLVVAAMFYSTGHISGAHINPAVTLAFALACHFPWRDVPFYWVAQLVGAAGASLALRGSLGPVGDMGPLCRQGAIYSLPAWR